MDATSPLAITGWLKKEADKGLKVGNLIKKPFNDRYFVLDTKEKRLCYYEKEQSETPNGFVDLAKVTKITKTGKHECEFLIEFSDGSGAVKSYTLQAPSVPKMELWIKAINIVRETTKFKHIGSGSGNANPSPPSSASVPTDASLPPASSSSLSSPKTEAPSTAADTTFKTALEPKQPVSSNAKQSATPSTTSPSSASFPKRASLGPSPGQSKAPNSTEVPRTNGSFLGTQRASMYSGAPPKQASASSVASRTATFESGTAKGSPASRWSSSKSPSPSPAPASPKGASLNSATPSSPRTSTSSSPTPSRTATQDLTSSPPNKSVSQSSQPASEVVIATISQDADASPSGLSVEASAQQIDASSSTTPISQISGPPSKDLAGIASNSADQQLLQDDEMGLDGLLASILTAPQPSNSSSAGSDASPTKPVVSGSHRQSIVVAAQSLPAPSEDTFQVGSQKVTIRSSLSSLAPQQMGVPLLSEAEFVSSSSPVVKAGSATSDEPRLKLEVGSARQRPMVPSPLALLEESIRASAEHLESPEPLQENTLREGEELVETPDRLVAILQQSKSNPSTEYRLKLNHWSLLGVKGVWVMQSTLGSEDETDDPYDPETSYTWHLPGFLQVRWHGHDQWHVTTRELSPADEITWDLPTIGRKLAALDAVIPVQRQALIYHLYGTVQKILTFPCVLAARNAFEVPLEQKVDSLSDPQLEKLIRSDLCTRLASVMLDGFNDWSILRKYHIWDFIHDAALEKTNLWSVGSIHLPLAVKDINLSSTDPNIRFRNFITTALGNRQLYPWMAELISNQPQVSDYYDDISLVRQLPTMFLHALAPLSNVPVQLSPEKSPPNRP